MNWSPGYTLAQVEKEVIMQAMRYYHNDRTRTASALGIAVRTLYNKLDIYEGKETEVVVTPDRPIDPKPIKKK